MNSKGGPLGLSVTFLRGSKLTVIGVCHQFWVAKTKEEEESFSLWENENYFEIQLFGTWMQTKTLTTNIWSDSRTETGMWIKRKFWLVIYVWKCDICLKVKYWKRHCLAWKPRILTPSPTATFDRSHFVVMKYFPADVNITMRDYLSLNLILFHWLNNDSFSHVALCETTWSYCWFEHSPESHDGSTRDHSTGLERG